MFTMRNVLQKKWTELERVWKTLYENNPHATAFQSYEFLSKTKKGTPSAMHPFELRGIRDINFVLYKDDEPAAIAPLLIRRTKDKNYLYLRGRFVQANYLDLLYRHDFSYDDFQYLLNWIEELLGNVVWDFSRITERSPTYQYCLKYFPQGPVRIAPCVSIPVYEGYEQWFESLSGKKRNRLRNTYKRLEEAKLQCSVRFYYGTPVEWTTRLKMMRLLSRHTFRKNNISFGILDGCAKTLLSLVRLFEPFSRMLAGSIMNYNVVVYINRDIAAFSSGLRNDDGRIMNISGVVNSNYLEYRPIGLLLDAAIKDLSDKNKRGEIKMNEFDLCTGDEQYKYEFGGKTHYNYYFQGSHIST
jgi:hypothetical protein